jgi:hypothetical protein
MGYLRDGYNLAAMQGAKGQPLGFVMTIFQKIASSSFAAVASTLRRRLLMLTIHEAVVCDENLDTDGRDRAFSEARELLRDMHALPDDLMGRAEVDRLLADGKIQLLRKLGEKGLPEALDSETASSGEEESAAALVAVALPEERKRILAYNLGNFLRRVALPVGVKHWSLTTLREKLIKIGAKVVHNARSMVFQMAEAAVRRNVFRLILERIRRLRYR